MPSSSYSSIPIISLLEYSTRVLTVLFFFVVCVVEHSSWINEYFFYFVLFCIVLYCIVLYCFILFWFFFQILLLVLLLRLKYVWLCIYCYTFSITYSIPQLLCTYVLLRLTFLQFNYVWILIETSLFFSSSHQYLLTEKVYFISLHTMM